MEALGGLSVVPRGAAIQTPCTGVLWKNACATKVTNPSDGGSTVATTRTAFAHFKSHERDRLGYQL